jgi:hypothetical protein
MARAPAQGAEDAREAYNPDQPRVPAGSPEGGQWTAAGGLASRQAARDTLTSAIAELKQMAGDDPKKLELLSLDIAQLQYELAGIKDAPVARMGSPDDQFGGLRIMRSQIDRGAFDALGVQPRILGLGDAIATGITGEQYAAAVEKVRADKLIADARRRLSGAKADLARQAQLVKQAASRAATAAGATRLYLKVAFAEKDIAKRYGAKWDPDRRSWYYPGTQLPSGLSRFSEAAEPPVHPDGPQDEPL